ncbi:sigma-70 family RNA polymerase sigma factor [Sorangium sp. So ce269]
MRDGLGQPSAARSAQAARAEGIASAEGPRVPSPPPPLTPRQRTLVEGAIPMVNRLAWALALRRFPGMRDELRSAGYEALVLSVRSYDARLGERFTTYAWRRIFGAMVDCARQVRPSSRSLVEAMRRAGFDLAVTLRDETDVFADGDSDVNRRLGDTCDDVATGMAVALGGGGIAPSGEEALIHREDYARAIRALAEARATLSPEGQTLLELRYEQGLTIPETAARVSLSEATVKRRCREMLARLQKVLAARGISSPMASELPLPLKET